MKYLEVRDSATYIPVVAFLPSEVSFAGLSEFALSEPERCRIIDYGLSRSGWKTVREDNPSCVIVVRLDSVEAHPTEFQWGSSTRTMRYAHEEISRRWNELRSGDVVDVEFILREKPTAKTSEALD